MNINSSPREALQQCKSSFIGIGMASALINLLYLTGSFFMLQVYDRVLPSKSVPTLVALCMLALLLYAFQGIFEILRSRMLVRISVSLDEVMNARIFQAMMHMRLRARIPGDGLQALRDFDQIRGFLSGMGPPALFDLPWLPFYVGICFLFDPIIGWITVFGAVFLAGITALTNMSSRKYAKAAAEKANTRNAFALASLRNAEVIHAMGMTGRITEIWEEKSSVYRNLTCSASDVANGYAALSKIFRMALQSGVLAAGALLVMNGSASGGIMIAASILTSRALAPVELAIANWKGFVGALQSWRRVNDLLSAVPVGSDPLPLPAPRNMVSVERITAGAPGSRNIVLSDVSFSLRAGSALGVIGASASGKSSLARAILQIWPLSHGSVRLDGAEIRHWSADKLGEVIGYCPQDVELFSGTIAQNISRFSLENAPGAVIAAAKAARVHELILRLPDGYDTEIGEGGMLLSAGQRQRIALARALYNDPFLIILDEPNSNLDADGEQALADAILNVRARGGIVIVIAHRPSVLSSVDHILVMSHGRIEAFGAKDDILGRSLRKPDRQLSVVADGAARSGA